MLDLARLRLLRELKARGTVAAVAAALGYTPSAVSQQLAALQREAGVPLLERVGRRLKLTDAGEVLARHAEDLLAGAEVAVEAARAAQGHVGGTVRVVAFQTALIHLVAPALTRLAARFPALTVEVIDDEFARVLQALLLREVDIVIACEYPHLSRLRRPDLAAEVLLMDPVRVAAPPGIDDSDGPLRLADLAGFPWATGHPGTTHAEMVVRACREIGGFEPDIRYRTNDLLALIALVRSGQAAALLPDLALVERTEAVTVRDIAGSRLQRQSIAWTRRGPARPAIEAVLAELRRAAAEVAAVRPGLRLPDDPTTYPPASRDH